MIIKLSLSVEIFFFSLTNRAPSQKSHDSLSSIKIKTRAVFLFNELDEIHVVAAQNPSNISELVPIISKRAKSHLRDPKGSHQPLKITQSVLQIYHSSLALFKVGLGF